MCLLHRSIFSLDLRGSGSVTGTVGGKNFDGGLDLLRASREGQLAERHRRLASHLPISHESLCRRTTCSILWGIPLERGAGARRDCHVLGDGFELLTLLTPGRYDHTQRGLAFWPRLTAFRRCLCQHSARRLALQRSLLYSCRKGLSRILTGLWQS